MMRSRVFRVLLFLLAFAIPLLGWTAQQHFFERSPAPSRSLAAVETPAPVIDANRLLTDVEALSFERYAESDRQRVRTYISQSLNAVGWDVQTQSFEGGVNLYADRPGTSPDAGTLLVGAHYDSVAGSPGADDNATGVVALLEIARLFADVPTPQTLRLAFFDLEEQGLIGSEAFVADERLTQNLTGAIILEMLGYACDTPGCQQFPPLLPFTPPTDRGDFLAALGDRDHAFLLDVFQATAEEASPAVLSLTVPVVAGIAPDLIRSDHAPFWRQGLGAVLLTDTANFRTPHYHQPTDRPATLSLPFFTQVTQIVVNGVVQLLQ
jgi:hypothetical protein